MNREKEDELPQMQVGFIDSICLPMYEAFAQLSDKLQPLLEGVHKNRQHWMELAKEAQQKNNELCTLNEKHSNHKKKKSNGLMDGKCNDISDEHPNNKNNTSSSSSNGSNDNSFHVESPPSSTLVSDSRKSNSNSNSCEEQNQSKTGNSGRTTTTSSARKQNSPESLNSHPGLRLSTKDANERCVTSEFPNEQSENGSLASSSSTRNSQRSPQSSSSYSQRNIVPSPSVVKQISKASGVNCQYCKCRPDNKQCEHQPTTNSSSSTTFEKDVKNIEVASSNSDCICATKSNNEEVVKGSADCGDGCNRECCRTASLLESDKIPKIVGQLSSNKECLMHQGTNNSNGKDLTPIPNGHLPASAATSSTTNLVNLSETGGKK